MRIGIHLFLVLVLMIKLFLCLRNGVISNIRTKSQYFSSQTQVPKVFLKDEKLKYFKTYNPIVFDGAIKKTDQNVKAGDLVYVLSESKEVIAKGMFNPFSQYRIRVLAHVEEDCFELPIEAIIKIRIENALFLRKSISLPSNETDSFRLINSEGDRLSGLIVDILGNYIVIQSSSLWTEKEYLKIIEILKSYFCDKHIIWKRSIKNLISDGLKETDQNAVVVHYSSKSIDSKDNLSRNSEFMIESGLKYNLDEDFSQKTGFYCDQRDNRRLLRKYSAGKSILDLFCYSGGFALNGALGGAKHITLVDSSKKAIHLAKENFELNGFDLSNIDFRVGDVDKALDKLGEEEKHFDIVICDPPKLSPSKASVSKAFKKYVALNTKAMKRINSVEGGLLWTFTCSASMAQGGRFQDAILEASRHVNREVSILSTLSSAGDHPVSTSWPDGRYLVGYLLHIR